MNGPDGPHVAGYDPDLASQLAAEAADIVRSLGFMAASRSRSIDLDNGASFDITDATARVIREDDSYLRFPETAPPNAS